MHFQDIQSAMAALYHANENYNNMMEETGGEFTPEAEELENVKNALADLLSGEGIDSLGRWLKSKEDEKAKGTFYTFSQFTSQKTSFDAEALDGKFLGIVTEAARKAGLPESVDVALKTTATRLAEDETLYDLVSVETAETCKFTKPKKEA